MGEDHPGGDQLKVAKSDNQTKIEQRVVRAAEATLADKHFVTAIDILVGVDWLSPPQVEQWRQGRIAYLERVTTANLRKISMAMHFFRSWALRRDLKPSETVYLSRTRGRRPLRFSKSGDPAIELAYRTHWVSPVLSEAKRERLADKQSKPPDLVVISALNTWKCSECDAAGENLLIMEDGGPLCLACADLDHLVYLPAGTVALTRRAKKASTLSAVVVRFSRARGRYERQGILVEEDALVLAEQECLADEEARLRRRIRDEEKRPGEDQAFREAFAREIVRLFPGCPPERAENMALRATMRGSGRVGRTAAGRDLDPEAVTLCVAAAVRHEETEYDQLLMAGMPREDARSFVRSDVQRGLDALRTPIASDRGDDS
jgi:hypothetical protein